MAIKGSPSKGEPVPLSSGGKFFLCSFSFIPKANVEGYGTVGEYI